MGTTYNESFLSISSCSQTGIYSILLFIDFIHVGCSQTCLLSLDNQCDIVLAPCITLPAARTCDLTAFWKMEHSFNSVRILHECQVWIDKSIWRVTFWHHEARRVMRNCDPRDRFVYPYLTHMMDSFSCMP